MPDPIEVKGEMPVIVEKPEGEKPDEFDKERAMALITKLRGEIKDLSGKAKKADEWEQAETKRKESEMTELQKLQKQLAEAQTQLKQEAKARLQREAAEKIGLPATFAKRLTGETPEELEADAKEIFDALPKQEKKTPNLSPTNPGGASQGETTAQRMARIHGTDQDVFSPEAARQLGGGVFFTTKTTEE
jgi:uncharacterized membrane protein